MAPVNLLELMEAGKPGEFVRSEELYEEWLARRRQWWKAHERALPLLVLLARATTKGDMPTVKQTLVALTKPIDIA